MCLSASTSFTAGAILVPGGVYCLWEAARKDATHVPLAALPLLFGLQQFAEGGVWRELETGSIPPDSMAAATFLAFAFAFWPIWLPFSMSWLVPHRWPLLTALGLLGAWIGWSLYSPVVIDPDHYLAVSVRHHSICYDVTNIPVLQVVPELAMRSLYALTIVGSLLLGNRKLQVFVAAVFASMIISELVFAYAFTSVWCLFAALLSAYLVHYVRELPTPVGRAGHDGD